MTDQPELVWTLLASLLVGNALLLVFGLLGLLTRRFGLPVLPLILGVILGPLMEFRLREAMAISGGDASGLLSEPLAVVIYAIVAVVVLAPIMLRAVRPARVEPSSDERDGELVER